MQFRRAVCVLVSIIALSACGHSNTPVVLGLAGPLTDPVGRSMRFGAELAVSQINQSGGISGRKVELLLADDFGRADTAVRVARRYREDGSVVAVIGHGGNVTTLAAAPVYGSGATPVVAISPSAWSTDFERAGPYSFRVCPDAVAHSIALGEWAASQRNIRTAAILYENNTEGRAGAGAFGAQFSDRGGLLVSEDPYSEALPSFEPYLTRAANRSPIDALVVLGGGSRINSIVAATDTVGLRPVILGTDALLREYPDSGSILEGAVLSSAYLPSGGGVRNEAFVAAYVRTHDGRKPDATTAASFDIVYLIARAITVVGVSRERIRGYLAGVGTSSEAFQGVTGQISFDEDGDLLNPVVNVGFVRDGTIEPASEP